MLILLAGFNLLEVLDESKQGHMVLFTININDMDTLI